MSATRCLPFLLGGLTLVVLFANAYPAAQRKHRLENEYRALVQRYREALAARDELDARVEALRRDPFVVERICAETWCAPPQGALPLAAVLAPGHPPVE